MRTIGVVTVARSDYGIYQPILKKIRRDPDLRLCLYVSGMHLSPEFGRTVEAIEQDGFEIAERVETLLSSDSPEGVAKAMGLGTLGFAQAFGRSRPDLLVVLGDRFEMHAAALAALPFKLPVAHIHGGELSLGAIDDALRHSMTKLSHLHFTSTEEYARRVMRMGEEPWRVTVSGAPGLDNIREISLLNLQEFNSRFKLKLNPGFLLATYHSVTLEYEQAGEQCTALLSALESTGKEILFTEANADSGGRTINRMTQEFAKCHPRTKWVANLGTQGYFSAMALAGAMVGNSSSGIIEAASLKLPVVNIGIRQQGRVRGKNVIDVGYGREEIQAGIVRALSPQFRGTLAAMVNPYGDGRAADKIVKRLKEVSLHERLIHKRFQEV